MKKKRSKLTLKAARTLAIRELGTAAGLKAREGMRPECQWYEMQMGNFNVNIASDMDNPGVAFIAFGGNWTYYDIETLEENHEITTKERRAVLWEAAQEMAQMRPHELLEVILREHGYEEARAMLQKVECKRNAKK